MLCSTGRRIDTIQCNRIEEPERGPYKHSTNFFRKLQKQFIEGKTAFQQKKKGPRQIGHL